SAWYKDAYQMVKGQGFEPYENNGSWISRAFRKIGVGWMWGERASAPGGTRSAAPRDDDLDARFVKCFTYVWPASVARIERERNPGLPVPPARQAFDSRLTRAS